MKIKLSKSQWEMIGKKAGWKVAQNLEVVKTPEKLTDRELTRAIRDAIIAEEGAIKQYETVVDATDNKIVKDTLEEIAGEERVHVGELQKLLNDLLPDEKEKLEEGEKEVEEKTARGNGQIKTAEINIDELSREQLVDRLNTIASAIITYRKSPEEFFRQAAIWGWDKTL